MSKKWWTWIGVFVLSGMFLTALGFWQFGFRSFSENLLAGAVGLTVALALAIWLIEGQALTRGERFRAIVEYKRQVFQVAGEIGAQIASEIAQPLATEFEPEIDLYGRERGNWDEFKPLLRQVFGRVRDVRYHGLPPYHGLTKEDADSTMQACKGMVVRVTDEIDEHPEFKKSEVLGGLLWTTLSITQHINRAYRLNLLDDPISRYTEIGELGDRVLDMVECITPLSEGSELW